MEPTDPNFLVQKPKKERTPAQKAATKNAFEKLKEKREAMKQEQAEEEVIEIRKVPKRQAPTPTTKPTPKEQAVESNPVIRVEEKQKPGIENKMNDDLVNTIVSRLKSELAPPVPTSQAQGGEKPVVSSASGETTLREKKKKKIVVVESESESSSSEEEVVIRRKKVSKQEPVKEPVKQMKEPEPFHSGSRVLDRLFFNK